MAVAGASGHRRPGLTGFSRRFRSGGVTTIGTVLTVTAARQLGRVVLITVSQGVVQTLLTVTRILNLNLTRNS